MDDTLRQEISILAKQLDKIDAVLASKIRFISSVIDTDANIKDIRRSLSVVNNVDFSQFLSDAFQYYHLRNWINKVFQVVRNFMVFVPIFFTWISLYFALNAYSTYVQINGQADSFLYLWQTGVGGGLNSWFLFSNVALLDAGFVGAIIMLTIIVSSSEESASEKAFSLKRKIEKIFWELDGALYEKYTALAISEGTLESIVLQLQSLTDSWQNRSEDICNFLAAEHARLERYSEIQSTEALDLKQAIATFYEASRIIVDTTNELKQQVGNWADVTITHSSTLIQISKHMETISGYTRLLQENGIIISTRISDLAKMEISVLNDFGSSSSHFVASGDKINNRLEHISEIIDGLNSEIYQLRSVLGSLAVAFSPTEISPMNNRAIEILQSIDQKLSSKRPTTANDRERFSSVEPKTRPVSSNKSFFGNIYNMIKSLWSENGDEDMSDKKRDK